ncbi:hypothetical protein [Enterocloster citroniae]
MKVNIERALKITFLLKNCNMEKVQMITFTEDSTEEEINTYIEDVKNRIKDAMMNNTVISSKDKDFILLSGDAIAYVKCECINIGDTKKE